MEYVMAVVNWIAHPKQSFLNANVLRKFSIQNLGQTLIFASRSFVGILEFRTIE